MKTTIKIIVLTNAIILADGSGNIRADYGKTNVGGWTNVGSFTAGSHILATSVAPTISACGTGTPSVSGGDNFGTAIAGTVATSCVIN